MQRVVVSPVSSSCDRLRFEPRESIFDSPDAEALIFPGWHYLRIGMMACNMMTDTTHIYSGGGGGGDLTLPRPQKLLQIRMTAGR